jgi:hypothetical protein
VSSRFASAGVVAAAIAYLAGLALAMNTVAYDIWGVLVVAPPMTVVTVLVLRRGFRDEQAVLVLPLLVGFAAKFVGSAARYWIAFDVYGGNADAGRYHAFGVGVAGRFWSGEVNPTDLIPTATGTQFVEEFTALLYSLVGSSRMAGFVLFGWFAYFGIVLFVKAGCTAVPGLARRRYAWLCALAPSLVYWPSSIGKEALMTCSLGIATYGIARIVTRRRFASSIAIVAAGLLIAALIRPHIAGVWLAATMPALLVTLGGSLRGATRGQRRGAEMMALVAVVAVAGMALVFVGQVAIRYLQPSDDETGSVTESVTSILDETLRRSDQGGSNFVPPTIDGPQDWPFAVVRTLTRPLPHEASGLLQLLSAAEMAVFLGLCLLGWRRLLALPRLVITTPYLAFAVSILFMAGLAYSSFANLGILTRQKSLVFPLLLLIPCLPAGRPPRDEPPREVDADRTLVRA